MNVQHSTPMAPLRARMIADMTARTLGPASQTSHLRACKRFTAWLGRSPDTATADDVKHFKLHLMETSTDDADKPPRVLALPCPCCGGQLIIVETIAPERHPRAPPGTERAAA